MPGASIYLSGYVYSTTCGVEPMPISRFTRVRRTRPLTAYYDPLGVLQGYQDPAILGNGDALVLADEPLFDAVLGDLHDEEPDDDPEGANLLDHGDDALHVCHSYDRDKKGRSGVRMGLMVKSGRTGVNTTPVGKDGRAGSRGRRSAWS